VEKIDIILTDCIKEIKSGRATLSDCLNRYPSFRQELEPLLKVALSIREPRIPNLDSNYKKDSKAELLQQISAVRQQKPGSFTDIFGFGLPARFVWARAAVTIIAIVIIVSLLAGGTAYASQGSLPGDLLYPVKLTAEDARLLVAGNISDKAKLNLRFARTRLEEMGKLTTGNEEKTKLALHGYQDNLDAAGERINSITDAPSLSSTLGWALENLNQQTAYCDSTIDTGAAYLQPVREANSLTIKKQIELLRILEQSEIAQAAQINIRAMQNRLQRAYAKAGENRFQVMQQVLLQYQEFNKYGEEILRRAQSMENHKAEIEALSLQALQEYLDTLDSIYLQAPQEYRNTIEACRQTTLEFQTQAGYRYRHQADFSGNDQTLPPGNGEGYGTGQGGQGTPQYQGGIGNTNNGTTETPPAPSPVNGQNMGSGNETGTGNGPGSNVENGTGEGNTGGGSESGGGTGSGGDSGTGGGDTGGGTGSNDNPPGSGGAGEEGSASGGAPTPPAGSQQP
jgi:uncharacterized membrane protein YgcG